MSNENLTGREKELLKYLQDGLSRKQAAEKSSMSKRTADTHLRNIFLKLSVHNIAGAIKEAAKNNLLNIACLCFFNDYISAFLCLGIYA